MIDRRGKTAIDCGIKLKINPRVGLWRRLFRWRLRMCGCGDILPVEDFCRRCGKCAPIGCCSCE
jgi:rRNA maturation endonuclease Nob1